MPMPQVAPPNTTGIPRIVVPGGIGDVYWVMVKLEAFCRREKIQEKPVVIILADDIWESSQLRSAPFLEMIPFVTTGNPQTTPMDPVRPRPKYLQNVYTKCGTSPDQTIWPGFMGYEYFICYNGVINSGHWLEADDLECNWYLPLTISKEQERFKTKCVKKYGDYVVFYFSNFTEEMLTKFSVDKIIESIRHFINRSGLTPVFIGAEWDLGWKYLTEIMGAIPGVVNLVGKTSLDQAFGVMRGAKLISGYHSGLTNLGIMFKKKTVLIWVGASFPPATPLAVAPPETRNTTYRPLLAEGLTIDRYVGIMKELHEQAD